MDRLFLIGIHIFMLLWRLLVWVLQSKNVWHKIGWFWILLIGSAAIRNTHCLAIHRDCWFGISLIASAAIGDLYGMAFHKDFTFSFHGSALPNRDPYFHDFMTTYCLSFTKQECLAQNWLVWEFQWPGFNAPRFRHWAASLNLNCCFRLGWQAPSYNWMNEEKHAMNGETRAGEVRSDW